jgi:ubiquinone/menaquinone biosynthesis C-methylase UbiE
MIMHPQLSSFLLNGTFVQGPDGIYSAPKPSFVSGQDAERKLREQVAVELYDNYLASIARHHSIPVMDYEIDHFLAKIPQGGLILDIGGCWGWHWRRLAETRPDLEVLIIDFVRANLVHAQRVLGPLVGTQVALMHADATDLPLPTSTFDGVWTVQAFQHIPNFARACSEAHRILKPGGFFVNYSLHTTPFNRMVYWLLGKTFHKEGMRKNKFHLNRANDRQRQIVVDIFIGEVIDRYTECLHHPDLRLTFGGRVGSPIGQFDKLLGELPRLGRWIARQRSFEARKSTMTSVIK